MKFLSTRLSLGLVVTLIALLSAFVFVPGCAKKGGYAPTSSNSTINGTTFFPHIGN